MPHGDNDCYEENESDSIEEASKATSEVIGLPVVNSWCSTGCTVLDLAIANQLPGGVPIGRIIHIFGGGSTAKTVLAITILGYAQRNGVIAHFADIEHTLDPVFAKLYGLNCEDNKTFKLGYPETLEEMFDDYLAGIIYPHGPKKKINDQPKVIVPDSITALPSKVELEQQMEKSTFGATRAKQMSLGFRKYISALANSNTTLICIDQTRDNIGIMFGNKEVTSGGRALEFYSSVQIYLKHDTNIVNSKKKTIGIWVKFRIVKNKVAPPFREGRFKILFDYGLDNAASNLHFIAVDQLGEKAAQEKTSKLRLFDEERTISSWIKHIEDNNLEDKLNQEVYRIWQEVHKTETRKPRVWS